MCWKMRAMYLDNCQGEASNSLAVPLFLSDFSNLTFLCLFVCERILLYIAQADFGLLIIWMQCWDYRYGLPHLKIPPSLSVFNLISWRSCYKQFWQIPEYVFLFMYLWYMHII